MTENEKLLFNSVSSLATVVSEMLGTQAEMNRLLADKLPNVSSVAQAALRANANELDQQMRLYGEKAKQLLAAVPKE